MSLWKAVLPSAAGRTDGVTAELPPPESLRFRDRGGP
jgi:hypothetical protein